MPVNHITNLPLYSTYFMVLHNRFKDKLYRKFVAVNALISVLLIVKIDTTFWLLKHIPIQFINRSYPIYPMQRFSLFLSNNICCNITMWACLRVVFSFPVGSYMNGPKTTQERAVQQIKSSITEPGAAIWTLLFFTQIHLTARWTIVFASKKALAISYHAARHCAICANKPFNKLPVTQPSLTTTILMLGSCPKNICNYFSCDWFACEGKSM